MRIVIAIHSLAGTGGTESYATTVGDHLQRLGHDVVIYGAEDGRAGDVARGLGLRVETDVKALPGEIDAVLSQDSIAALELLAARPLAPQIYIWHSDLFDVQVPPQLDGVIARIVTLYSDARKKLEGLAVRSKVVELAHPVDSDRFKPQTPLHERPRAVSLGNYLTGERKRILERACEAAGIELTSVGALAPGGETSRPEDVLNSADIVFAKAKTAIEGMACGRAVFIYDVFGSDGWVTAERYPRLAAACFGGNGGGQTVDVESMKRALSDYDPAMGIVNRDLAVANHSAVSHAAAIAKVVEEVAAEARDGAVPQRHDALYELARLARVNWRHESRAFGAAARLQQSELAQGDLAWKLEQAEAELAAERSRADHVERRLAEIVKSQRWRMVNAVLAPLDRLRRRH